MYYLIYKITNLINGKIYIGSHKTNDINDSYMGSGKLLLFAQKKYGIENFKKEILFVFDNPTEMLQKEAELVDENFLLQENTYNLKRGGSGGFDFINSRPDIFLTQKRLDCLKLGTLAGAKKWLKYYHSDTEFKNHALASLEKGRKTLLDKYPNGTWLGKKHREDSKKLIGRKNSENQQGQKNSQFGTMWITDGTVNTKIKVSDSIPEGWSKGRVCKRST